MGFFFIQPCLLPILKYLFNGCEENFFTRNPLHKPITTAGTKHDISLFWIVTSLFYSMYHPTNRAFAISLVTPKSCFLINIICRLYHHINFSNHVPQVGHTVSVKFLHSFEKMVSPISNTPYPYILAHAVWDFLMLSHYICPTYIPFLRDNLKVTHATPIKNSPFNI